MKMATPTSKEMLKVAEKMWGMLDHLAETDPEEYKKFVDQQIKEGHEMFSPPEPAFCLRSEVLGERRCRLYINVCKWIRVPKPKKDSDPIPVKGGTLRHVTRDKQKTKDLIIDIAFNPYVLEECEKDKVLEGMLISLSLKFFEDFTQLKVSRENCVKIRETFKGLLMDIRCSLDEQWRSSLSDESKLDIGDSILKQLSQMRMEETRGESAKLPPLKLTPKKDQDKQKLIEELGSKASNGIAALGSEASNGIAALGSEASNGITVPEYSMVIREADCKHPRRVCMRVCLPGVSSVGEVELEVSRNDLHLSVFRQYNMTVQLPAAVNEDLTKASFNPRTAILSVTTPCL